MKTMFRKSLPIFSIYLLLLTFRAELSVVGADGTTLNASLANLYQISDAESRSISPENFTGEKGKAGMATNGTGRHASSELGRGWKVSPSVGIKAGTTFTLGEIKGPGCINQIWMTPTGNWRHSILRFYWDGETNASVSLNVRSAISLPADSVNKRPDQFAGGLRQSRQRLQLLLADAVSQEGADHVGKFG